MKKISTKKMTVLALFCALAVVLTLLFRVPLVPSVSFLTYDAKDVVIGMGGIFIWSDQCDDRFRNFFGNCNCFFAAAI